MRAFAKPMGIDRLSLEARVLYTCFCLFVLLGGLSSAWFTMDDGLGATPASARRYYLGDDVPTAAGGGGPDIELPGDGALPSTSLRLAKPARQIMETFHFHLFTVPVCLLIVGHLFMMCALATRVKAWLIAVCSVATLVHLLGPPLVRFASPAFAVVVFPSAVIMGALWAFLTAWPCWEMWRRPPAVVAPPAE